MISVKKTLKTLKCKTNPFPAKFVLKIPTKLVFLYQLFLAKFALKIPATVLQNQLIFLRISP